MHNVRNWCKMKERYGGGGVKNEEKKGKTYWELWERKPKAMNLSELLLVRIRQPVLVSCSLKELPIKTRCSFYNLQLGCGCIPLWVGCRIRRLATPEDFRSFQILASRVLSLRILIRVIMMIKMIWNKCDYLVFIKCIENNLILLDDASALSSCNTLFLLWSCCGLSAEIDGAAAIAVQP